MSVLMWKHSYESYLPPAACRGGTLCFGSYLRVQTYNPYDCIIPTAIPAVIPGLYTDKGLSCVLRCLRKTHCEALKFMQLLPCATMYFSLKTSHLHSNNSPWTQSSVWHPPLLSV